MAQFPVLPLWTDAYIADTLDLSLEEHGCYLMLLMLAWRQVGCSMPDDNAWFCRWLNIHGNRWRKLRQRVLERFFAQDESGCWQQLRLSKERDSIEKTSRNRREIAEKRWSKVRENRHLADANGYASISISIKKESESSPNLESKLQRRSPRKHTTVPQPKPAAPPPVAAKPPRPKRVCKDYPDQFEEVWRVYPRRDEDDKPSCEKWWRSVVKSDTPELIVASANLWYREQAQNPYRFGLRKWLRDRVYRNDPPVYRPREEPQSQISVAAEWADEMSRKMNGNGEYHDANDEIITAARSGLPVAVGDRH
jgi:uncharacterized protein YdaU (DUF1376 family)